MSSEWVIAGASVVNAVVIIVLAVVTKRYVDETKRIADASREQAEASARMAQSTLHPAIIQWIEKRDLPTQQKSVGIIINYQNIGNGPAFNIRWSLSPVDGDWLDTPARIGMAAGSQGQARVKIQLPLSDLVTVEAEYQDISRTSWKSILTLIQENGAIANGSTAIQKVGQ